MGCTVSKLHNEDTVRSCKDRRRLMKSAVYARHHLAAAHADYFRSLRITGSALSVFAAGEPLSVSDQTPHVFLYTPQNPSPAPSKVSNFSTSSVPLRVPSPPPPPFSPNIASSKLPHILSDSTISPSFSQRRENSRKKQPPKLPHILSESSVCDSPRSQKSNFTADYPYAYPNWNYSCTPSQSQASSVWNWENFYPPPSPPDSEFFQTRSQTRAPTEKLYHQPNSDSFYEESDPSEYDFFLKKSEIQNNEDTEREREEVQCSEWGDRCSTTSSSEEDELDGTAERDLRSEIGSISNYERSVKARSVAYEPVARPGQSKYRGVDEKFDDEGLSRKSNDRTGEISEMKMVVRHKDLKEIMDAIEEHFEKAAEAGDAVSEMLETGRAQLDRNFGQLKRTVYHSNSLLSNLSSSWTSKPPLAVKYRLDTSFDQPGGPKSLCSTLDRLFAWEKKLYEEVKARETVKIEHEKKLSVLQRQEYRGESETKLDKTKASIKRLQSLIMVTSQAVSTTSTAINGLRDSDLVPQLVELCHGFMYMWRSMHQHHEVQNNIIQQVRGLVNLSTKGDSISELHRQATCDLESAVSSWHSSFSRLIKFQRDFIRSLHGWFKLSLMPLNNDNLSNNKEPSEVYTFLDEWKLALDRVPDTVASEAIKSFINVVHVISIKQSEELKTKKRTETLSKELEKKASSVRNIERKFYNSYSVVGIGLPDSGHDNGQVLDARDPLAEKKSELVVCQRRVEDEMVKYSKAVEVTRAMTLNNLRTGLPGVFQALTSFSSLFIGALESVCTRSYDIK